MIDKARSRGFTFSTRPLVKPMNVEGVGSGAQSATTATKVDIGVNGETGTYTAPVIPDSDLPPLLGLKTLREHKTILDMSGPVPELIFLGPGGYKLQLSPGSTRLPLKISPSGHLIPWKR